MMKNIKYRTMNKKMKEKEEEKKKRLKMNKNLENAMEEVRTFCH